MFSVLLSIYLEIVPVMSLLARNVMRQSQCLSRHLIIASRPLSSRNNNNKSHQSDNKKWFGKTLVISLGVCTGICYLKEHLSAAIPKVNAATPAVSRRAQFNFLADVVETAAKSLVYIEIQDTRRMDYLTGKPATVSNGSGFIVDSDGLILTNAHVVVNKPRSVVSVKLSDGRVFMGVVEAVDPISDLATVRIQCKKLPALKLGVSASLRSGEFVVALGSPLGETISRNVKPGSLNLL